MKTLYLFAFGAVVACGLASCSYDDDPYNRAYAARTFTPYGPPTYASPSYVNDLTSTGTPYRYGLSGDMRTVYYRRIPSPRGSYHYVFQDTAQPQPPPDAVMKAKTWRHTSSWPSIWGSPVWVSAYKPTYTTRWERGSHVSPSR